MMRGTSGVVLATVFALLLYQAIPSYAEHGYEITVTIGDTTLTSSGPGHASVNIAGTYDHAATQGQITITNAGGMARVELSDSDGSEDSIRLLDANIKANNTKVTNFPITFKRRTISGPDTPPNVYYKMYAKGGFDLNSGGSINIGWYGKNPLSNGFFFLGSRSHTPGLPTFALTPQGTAWPIPPHLTGDRVPKIEFVLKLGQNKSLNFDSTLPPPNDNRMIKLYTTGSPDRVVCTEKNADCDVQDEISLYLPYQYEASQVVGVRKWWCRWLGFGCPD